MWYLYLALCVFERGKGDVMLNNWNLIQSCSIRYCSIVGVIIERGKIQGEITILGGLHSWENGKVYLALSHWSKRSAFQEYRRLLLSWDWTHLHNSRAYQGLSSTGFTADRFAWKFFSVGWASYHTYDIERNWTYTLLSKWQTVNKNWGWLPCPVKDMQLTFLTYIESIRPR